MGKREQFGMISISGVMMVDLEQLRLGPTSGVQSAPFLSVPLQQQGNQTDLGLFFFFSFIRSCTYIFKAFKTNAT